MVSVVIGTYNRYDLVLKSIESVKNQTYKDVEIIVVDDCSTDKRYKNLEKTDGIRYFKTEKNSGLPAVPRNIGIKESKGEWICFLDDDDFFLPNKIEKQMEFTKNYDFICCDAFCDYNLTKKYAKGLYISVWNKFNKTNTNLFDYELIQKHNLIINSSVLIKKECLLDINFITEDEKYKRTEDYHTWLNLLRNKTRLCYFIDEPLIFYNMYSEKLV